MSRPAFGNLWVAGFQLKAGKTVKLLDSGYRPALIAAMLHTIGAEAPSPVAQAVMRPLIAACSFPRCNANRADRPFVILGRYETVTNLPEVTLRPRHEALIKTRQMDWAHRAAIVVDDQGYCGDTRTNLPWLTPETIVEFSEAGRALMEALVGRTAAPRFPHCTRRQRSQSTSSTIGGRDLASHFRRRSDSQNPSTQSDSSKSFVRMSGRGGSRISM